MRSQVRQVGGSWEGEEGQTWLASGSRNVSEEESWERTDKGSGFDHLSSGTLWTPRKADKNTRKHLPEPGRVLRKLRSRQASLCFWPHSLICKKKWWATSKWTNYLSKQIFRFIICEMGLYYLHSCEDLVIKASHNACHKKRHSITISY